MSMSRRKRESQADLFVATTDLPRSPGHPFYDRLNKVLGAAGFDAFVEGLCEKFYAGEEGRPSIPPGVYMRMLLIGYFEGIDSERGIAWRCCDSMTVRSFLGYTLTQPTPEHSSLSRIRRRLDVETHEEVFGFVLKILAQEKLIRGQTIGVDATTLEANAAMKSIVRRDSGESYEEFLARLAKSSGIETPTRSQLARIDKKRPKKGSNDDWRSPNDPDAEITKMKDGRTHLAHKAEHAVDMDSGAVLAVTLQPATCGDTTSVYETMKATIENLAELKSNESGAETPVADVTIEWVADKGYHSNDTVSTIEDLGMRGYISEPDRGRRRWRDKEAERDAVYANRRRIKGRRGRRLMKLRGERIERTFAHCLETGAMRRTHLCRHENIIKRYLVHVAAFNLGILMRKLFGVGTPRGLQGRLAACLDVLRDLRARLGAGCRQLRSLFAPRVFSPTRCAA